MSLFIFLTVIQAIVAAALVTVVLMQRSEGGALGMGGGPSGFMTARGAGNLLTKSTWILAILFFILALSLTVAGNMSRGSSSGIDADAVGDAKLFRGRAGPAVGLHFPPGLSRDIMGEPAATVGVHEQRAGDGRDDRLAPTRCAAGGCPGRVGLGASGRQIKSPDA